MVQQKSNTISLSLLRILASHKSEKQKEKLYSQYQEQLTFYFINIGPVQALKKITQETDPYLQEIECEILSNLLAHYQGPISEAYLQHFFQICPPSCVWYLATEAKFDIIKNKAREQLEIILEYYDNEEAYQKDYPWQPKIWPKKEKIKKEKRNINEKY